MLADEVVLELDALDTEEPASGARSAKRRLSVGGRFHGTTTDFTACHSSPPHT
jgi:hypothetical protein